MSRTKKVEEPADGWPVPGGTDITVLLPGLSLNSNVWMASRFHKSLMRDSSHADTLPNSTAPYIKGIARDRKGGVALGSSIVIERRSDGYAPPSLDQEVTYESKVTRLYPQRDRIVLEDRVIVD